MTACGCPTLEGVLLSYWAEPEESKGIHSFLFPDDMTLFAMYVLPRVMLR